MICSSCQKPNPDFAIRCQHCLTVLPIPDALANGSSLGQKRYTIDRVLGCGGFGITYLALQSDGTRVAIKELFSADIARRLSGGFVVPHNKLEFEHLLVRAEFEAQTLQLLKHPSATRCFGYWQENGTIYTAMEFISGETLEQRIESGVKLREIEARRILMACLEVLQELHGLGLLHRDIKPANIILNSTRVELIDYGSAVHYKLGQRSKHERLLTPMYAPLEQFGYDVQLTPATDFYALAKTLYHALTQTIPANALDRARGVQIQAIRQLEPHLSPSLAKVIDDSLAMKLEDRPKNAALLLQEIHFGVEQHIPVINAPNPTLLEVLHDDLIKPFSRYLPTFYLVLLLLSIVWFLSWFR